MTRPIRLTRPRACRIGSCAARRAHARYPPDPLVDRHRDDDQDADGELLPEHIDARRAPGRCGTRPRSARRSACRRSNRGRRTGWCRRSPTAVMQSRFAVSPACGLTPRCGRSGPNRRPRRSRPRRYRREQGPPRADAREPRGIGVVAGGVDVPAERRAVEDVPEQPASTIIKIEPYVTRAPNRSMAWPRNRRNGAIAGDFLLPDGLDPANTRDSTAPKMLQVPSVTMNGGSRRR